ncbi:hypothetical protein FOA52_010676 [Chlamydomonas sp. UWO 241]|nr:hypothetical protein FOA52_010676 [Chlamydomonas sp. UWO 241]
MKRSLLMMKAAGARHSDLGTAHAGALACLDECVAAAQAAPELSHLLDLFRAKLELMRGGGSTSWATSKAHIFQHVRMETAQQPYSLSALKLWVERSCTTANSFWIIEHTLRGWAEGPFQQAEACAWLNPSDEAIIFGEDMDKALGKKERLQALIAELVTEYEKAKDKLEHNLFYQKASGVAEDIMKAVQKQQRQLQMKELQQGSVAKPGAASNEAARREEAKEEGTRERIEALIKLTAVPLSSVKAEIVQLIKSGKSDVASEDMDQMAVDVIRKLEAALRRHKETGKWFTWTAPASAPSAAKSAGRDGITGSDKPGGKGGASRKAGAGGREVDAGRITDVKDWMHQFGRNQLTRRDYYSRCSGWVASNDHFMSGRLMDGREGNLPSLWQVLEGSGASVGWLEHAVGVLAFLEEVDSVDPNAVLERFMDESASMQLDPTTSPLSDYHQDMSGFRSSEYEAVEQAVFECDPSLQHLGDAEVIQATSSATFQLHLVRGHMLLMRERSLAGPEMWPAGQPTLNAHPLFWSWDESADQVDVAVSPSSDMEVSVVLAQALARATAARKAEAEACTPGQSDTPDALLAAQLRLDIADSMGILSEANVLTPRLLSPIRNFLVACRKALPRGLLRLDRDSLLAELRSLDLDQLRSLRVVLLWELGGFRGAATRAKLRASLSADLASHNISVGAALGIGDGSIYRQVVVREDSLAHAAAYAAYQSGLHARDEACEEWWQQAAMPSAMASGHLPVARQPKWPLQPALGTRAAEDALVDFLFDPTIMRPGVHVPLMDVGDTVSRWMQTMEWIACLSWNASHLSGVIQEVLVVECRSSLRGRVTSNDDVERLFVLAIKMIDCSKFWQTFLEWRCEMLDTAVGLSRQRQREFEAMPDSERQQHPPAGKVAMACQPKSSGQAKDNRETEGSRALERERSAIEQAQMHSDNASHFESLSATVRSAANTPVKSLLHAQGNASALMAALPTAISECVAYLKQTVFMVDHMAIEIQATFSELAQMPPNMECALITEPFCWEALVLSWRAILGEAAKSSNALALVEQDEADTAKKKAEKAATEKKREKRARQKAAKVQQAAGNSSTEPAAASSGAALAKEVGAAAELSAPQAEAEGRAAGETAEPACSAAGVCTSGAASQPAEGKARAVESAGAAQQAVVEARRIEAEAVATAEETERAAAALRAQMAEQQASREKAMAALQAQMAALQAQMVEQQAIVQQQAVQQQATIAEAAAAVEVAERHAATERAAADRAAAWRAAVETAVAEKAAAEEAAAQRLVAAKTAVAAAAGEHAAAEAALAAMLATTHAAAAHAKAAADEAAAAEAQQLAAAAHWLPPMFSPAPRPALSPSPALMCSHPVLGFALRAAARAPTPASAGPVPALPVRTAPAASAPAAAPSTEKTQQQVEAVAPAVTAAAASAPRHHPQRRPRHDDDESWCVVCLERPRSITLDPCGHHLLCSTCCVNVRAANNECPMCRKSIERTHEA